MQTGPDRQLIDSLSCLTEEEFWISCNVFFSPPQLVFTAALGFDSFLVMRHGMRPAGAGSPQPTSTAAIPRDSIPGHMLGCYFCNDVVAPGNVSVRESGLAVVFGCGQGVS